MEQSEAGFVFYLDDTIPIYPETAAGSPFDSRFTLHI